jgi:hypothetical protein
MPQLQKLYRVIPYIRAVVQRRFIYKRILAPVQTRYRTEYAVLNPPQIQFLVAFPEMMAAYVVAPPSKTDIRRGGGEIRHKI